MSELAERAKQLRARTWTKIGFDTNDQDFTQRYDALIEQALLAERASVWATAIEAIRNKKALPGLNRVIAISALRAAAEKEVVK